MELSSVRIDILHGNPGFHGAAGDHPDPAGVLQSARPASAAPAEQYSGIPNDQHSSTTSSSGTNSPLFAASPAAAEPGRPDRSGSSTASVIDVQRAAGQEREKALKSLKESIPHGMKLQQLQKSEKQHQKDRSWHRRNVRRLSKELYLIMSWYAVLMGVLFAAVAQTSIFTCEDLWGPVCTAVLVTVGTLASVLDKLYRMDEEQQQVLLFQTRQNAVYDNIAELYSYGSACNLDTLQPQHELDPTRADPGLLCVFAPHGFLVLGFLVGFSVLIIMSCFRMLCGPLCNCSHQ